MKNISDKEILKGIIESDEKVIFYIINHYFSGIKRFIFKNKGNAQDAEDIFQESLIIVFEKIRNRKLEINCAFGTYLFGIAKIVWFNELKKRNYSEVYKKHDGETIIDSGVFEQIELRERQYIYKEYFNKLGEECKKLMEHFFNGTKIKEITGLMGYKSDQHTKNRKYICKKQLIENIRSNPRFKEIKNERLNNLTEIPRW